MMVITVDKVAQQMCPCTNQAMFVPEIVAVSLGLRPPWDRSIV